MTLISLKDFVSWRVCTGHYFIENCRFEYYSVHDNATDIKKTELYGCHLYLGTIHDSITDMA